MRGRTASTILASQPMRTLFDADVAREAKRLVPHPIGGGEQGQRAVIELRKMLVHAVERAGVT